MSDPRVGFYDDPVFREHDSGWEHPERPERVDAVARGALGDGLSGRLLPLRPRAATREEIVRVHLPEHYEKVSATQGKTHRFDPDTQAGPHSFEAAALAAGAVVDAVDRVLDGELDSAFCAVRPPGHHAEAARAMGFCLFNNVAVAAAHALARGLERVMVIDFDVHHGNGTQRIFESDPRVLYLSSHAYPFYPGSGALEEAGRGDGEGFTVNLPLPAGCGDAEYAALYRRLVVPIGRDFDPELLLVSAGYDSGRGDPLAPMDVTERGFAAIVDACLSITEGTAAGRAVFALEGGYDLGNLERATGETLRAMLDDPQPPLEGEPHPRMSALIDAFRSAHSRYWRIA